MKSPKILLVVLASFLMLMPVNAANTPKIVEASASIDQEALVNGVGEDKAFAVIMFSLGISFVVWLYKKDHDKTDKLISEIRTSNDNNSAVVGKLITELKGSFDSMHRSNIEQIVYYQKELQLNRDATSKIIEDMMELSKDNACCRDTVSRLERELMEKNSIIDVLEKQLQRLREATRD